MPVSWLTGLGDLRRRLAGAIWRGALLAAVAACSLAAMAMGVGFSERPGVNDADFFTRLYDTIGLFVLGGLDLGTPTGGTPFGRGLLWFAYFAAPAITTASLVEGLLRTLNPTRWRLRRLRGHIVVVGCGRMSRLYLSRLRRDRRHKPVVVVDLRADHPAATEITDMFRAELIVGDIREDALLKAIHLDRADRVFLFTGNDFVNLDAAAKILALQSDLAERTVVHVANLHFLRVISDTRVARECIIINKYHVAASELVRSALLAHFHKTEGNDTVVLAGFGRFGQTVLDELQRAAREKFDRVVIIDTQAGEKTAVFAQQVGFDDFYQRQVVDGDLSDPRVWQQVKGLDQANPVFVLGCGVDDVNLSNALWIKSAFPNAYVMVRNFYRSSFASEVSAEAGIHICAVAELIENSMPESWFGRRKKARGKLIEPSPLKTGQL